MIRKHFNDYNFVGIPETGATFRWGNKFNENPRNAPWPELADVSISNLCDENCEYCYKSSNPQGKCISLQDYNLILDELSSPKFGSIFQVALGGGEPLLHPNFVEILKMTREHNIIPNYTTNGKHFNQKNIEATKKYCGAVAISFDPYRSLSFEDISKIGQKLVDENIKVNIHYVLSEKTIGSAIEILNGKYDSYLQNFNSIIFLTYKPFGNAFKEDLLKSEDKLLNFLELIDNPKTNIKIGFDACFIPVLLKKTNINSELVDSCECGYFSVYVNENLDVMPCSFCGDGKFKFNLKEYHFDEIWSVKFTEYKKFISNNRMTNCESCNELECRGPCPFFEDIFLCKILK